jgi:hypothetical protein
MSNVEWSKIDHTNWNREFVQSFTSVSDFVSAHITMDWFTEDYLKQVYGIIVDEKKSIPKKKD